MNIVTIVLAFVLIWPMDNTAKPVLTVVVMSDMATCQQDTLTAKTELLKKEDIRYVSTDCIEMVRGEKS